MENFSIIEYFGRCPGFVCLVVQGRPEFNALVDAGERGHEDLEFNEPGLEHDNLVDKTFAGLIGEVVVVFAEAVVEDSNEVGTHSFAFRLLDFELVLVPADHL